MFDKTKIKCDIKRNGIASLRLVKVFVLAFVICFSGCGEKAAVSNNSDTTSGKPEPTSGIEQVVVAVDPNKDYSKFTHSNEMHGRLPCMLCHKRDDNSPKIGFPTKSDHMPCAGCHQVQFEDKANSMCLICHSNAETGEMKQFPRLETFNAKFDHAKHLGTNCATCHQSSGRAGVARSIPSGASAHTTCFSCHSNEASIEMASCSTCHEPGRLSRTSEWAVAYRKSFNHARHLSGNRMNCTACHTVLAGMARGQQVTSPLTAMHFAPANALSCGKCHNDRKAFGPADFEDCKRCHDPKTFKF